MGGCFRHQPRSVELFVFFFKNHFDGCIWRLLKLEEDDDDDERLKNLRRLLDVGVGIERRSMGMDG